MTTVAAPDFYHYHWYPLTTAERAGPEGRTVVCRWADGQELTAYDLWLRESAVGLSIDPTTRECVTDPVDLPTDHPAIAEALVTPDGALAITWWDGASSTHHPGWLRHVAEGLHQPRAWLPEPVAWEAADLGREPPTHHAPSPDRWGEVAEGWAEDLVRYGVARLRGLAPAPATVDQVGSALGALRATNFGVTWDVKVDADTTSTANTGHRLAPHTDLPTRETPPGFQLLLCLANSVEGGHSTMADGLAVVDHLARHHPDHHEALCRLHWVFFNRGPTVDHRWSGPIIDHAGGLLTLRAFHPVRAFPDMAPEDVPRAYEALRVFSTTAADPRFQLRYPFQPGDLIGFDNRRVLHGRDAYDAAGHRHLRGCYLDRDEVLSTVRRQARARARAATAPSATLTLTTEEQP